MASGCSLWCNGDRVLLGPRRALGTNDGCMLPSRKFPVDLISEAIEVSRIVVVGSPDWLSEDFKIAVGPDSLQKTDKNLNKNMHRQLNEASFLELISTLYDR
ncbi:hypothetical protein STEG23_025218 [Scotinomys teguina]